ncbi:MAG: hypothetical protein L0Y72_15570 [Gemmataceae bacterium]|nr:hypothetical protein [Gemmataceae bacterium]MCI0740465.1 hypothetical protein [Gemmataceae bacterium]
MWPFSQWTTAGRAALTYITIGALTAIWAGVWYVYLFNNPRSESAYYWCTGLLVTGFAMVLIGLGVGMFARSAQHSDLRRVGVPVAVANLQPNAATAPAPVLAPLDLTSPVAAPNRQVVFAPPEELSPG